MCCPQWARFWLIPATIRSKMLTRTDTKGSRVSVVVVDPVADGAFHRGGAAAGAAPAVFGNRNEHRQTPVRETLTRVPSI